MPQTSGKTPIFEKSAEQRTDALEN